MPEHQHGGTDAPECTTCPGRTAHPMTEPKLTEAQEDRWFQLQGEGLSSRAIVARMIATAEEAARAEALARVEEWFSDIDLDDLRASYRATP